MTNDFENDAVLLQDNDATWPLNDAVPCERCGFSGCAACVARVACATRATEPGGLELSGAWDPSAPSPLLDAIGPDVWAGWAPATGEPQ